MNDVASAWLMTSLAPSPLWVALVQSASTLPVFLLGLPSGALADMLDRRRFLMVTQFWVAGSAWVFALNAVLSVVAGFTIMCWRRVHRESPLGRERFTSAMRVGLPHRRCAASGEPIPHRTLTRRCQRCGAGAARCGPSDRQ